MSHFIKKTLISFVTVLFIGGMITACSTEEPNAPNKPDTEQPDNSENPDNSDNSEQPESTETLSGPTSITLSNGAKIYQAKYDSENRLTYLKNLQNLEVNITYSPLTLNYNNDGNHITIDNIQVNSLGFITGYSFSTEKDEDEGMKTLTLSATYDEDGHLTHTIQHDPEYGDYKFDYTWVKGNLTAINYCHSREGERDIKQSYTITYNGKKNPRGVFSPNWTNGWDLFTGLFGKAPAEFPATITLNDVGNTVEYTYELLPDGRIHTEKMSNNESSMYFLTYHY